MLSHPENRKVMRDHYPIVLKQTKVPTRKHTKALSEGWGLMRAMTAGYQISCYKRDPKSMSRKENPQDPRGFIISIYNEG
jgi:hypothetical protein